MLVDGLNRAILVRFKLKFGWHCHCEAEFWPTYWGCVWSRFWTWSLVEFLKVIRSRFWDWNLVRILMLNFNRDFELKSSCFEFLKMMFGRDFKTEGWSKFWSWILINLWYDLEVTLVIALREEWRYQIGWIFRKVPGEGVIFNPKIFGNFSQGFLITELIQKSNFRAQGMSFFNNCIVLQLYYAYIWKSCACISYYPAIIYPVIKNCNILFQKWEGGVEGCLDFFQKFIRFGIFTLPSTLGSDVGLTIFFSNLSFLYFVVHCRVSAGDCSCRSVTRPTAFINQATLDPPWHSSLQWFSSKNTLETKKYHQRSSKHHHIYVYKLQKLIDTLLTLLKLITKLHICQQVLLYGSSASKIWYKMGFGGFMEFVS